MGWGLGSGFGVGLRSRGWGPGEGSGGLCSRSPRFAVEALFGCGCSLPGLSGWVKGRTGTGAARLGRCGPVGEPWGALSARGCAGDPWAIEQPRWGWRATLGGPGTRRAASLAGGVAARWGQPFPVRQSSSLEVWALREGRPDTVSVTLQASSL